MEKSLLRAFLTAILIGVLVLAIAMRFETVQTASASGDWSMFRSDPSHSGVGTDNPRGSSVLTPTLLWKTDIQWNLIEWNTKEEDVRHKERDWTEPAVVGDVVYVGLASLVMLEKYGANEFWRIDVYAFNAANGAKIWNYRDISCEKISSPAVVNGVVYFATDKYTCALNASSGSLLWTYDVGMFFSNPVVVEDRLFIGNGHTIAALNTSNGNSVWNYTADGVVYSPAVANGIVYVGSADWNIYAFNASTGTKIWVYFADDVLNVPTVVNGVVYAFLHGDNILALDAVDGTKIWNCSIYHGWGTVNPNLAIIDDVIYARSLPYDLYALNAASGVKIWNRTFKNEISTPTVVNDVIYLGSDNQIYALNAKNGERLWNYTTGGGFGSPIVANDIVYVSNIYGNEENQLYAIAVPSPTFPALPVAVVIAVAFVVIGAGLLVYFKKRKH